jgi:flagellar protein FlaF
MGFSVSASTAVVFLGMFIAAGVLYPAVSNGGELVMDARQQSVDSSLAQTNTEIDLFRAVYYTGNETLHVNATNTGTTTLDLTEVNVLVDNVPNSTDASYETAITGNTGTEVWLPGEDARFRSEFGDTSGDPDRVKLVVDHGVSEAIDVEVR